ncbi:Gfo/Idh/MocA family protein [Paenibacillus sp. GYB003]|uniref:Gfo/Idh/MocA family protein n=1 Tax=Paenibacillus sp. GYB003 TaxID=2994392 RepID=UPI002F96282C
MKTIKVGVVGIGSIAHIFHLPNYKAHPQVELTAVADTDLARARRVAEEAGGIRAYGSAEDMFASETLDAVSICTFNESHVPLALLALEHGLDVLVEKPMAMTVEQSAMLKERAARGGNIVMVGMSHRFRPDAQALQGIVSSGQLGGVYFAKTRILRRRGVPEGWFTSKRYSGGGPMMDIGVHALDLAWWMMGRPEPEQVMGRLFREVAPYGTKGVSAYKAKSAENKERPIYDVEDMGAAFITFANGAVLTLEASWAINGKQDDAIKVELYGTQGGATLDPLALYTESNGILVESGMTVGKYDFYKSEIEHFVECVSERRQPLVDAAQGHEVMRMLEAIRLSSETGESVRC